jgi:hypothetical protein
LGTLEDLHRRYGDRVEFLFVYVREAHAGAGWSGSPQNAVACTLPASEERQTSIPCVRDTPEGKVANAYDAWPKRLLVVGVDGRVGLDLGRGLDAPGKITSLWELSGLRHWLESHADPVSGSAQASAL